MTIKEALTTKTRNLSLTGGQIDLALLEGNLNGADSYVPATDGKALDMVYITLLLTSIAVSEVREDDVSIKFTTDNKGVVSAISRKWGLVDPFAPARPTVKQKQIW